MAKHTKDNSKRQTKNKQRTKEHAKTQKKAKKAAKTVGIASGVAEVMASPVQAPREGDDEYDRASVARPTTDQAGVGTDAGGKAAKGEKDWKDSLMLDFGKSPVPDPRSSPWSTPAEVGPLPVDAKVDPGIIQPVAFPNDFFAGGSTGVNIAGQNPFAPPEVTGGKADALFGTGQLAAFSFLPTTSPLGSGLANISHLTQTSITRIVTTSPSRTQAKMSGSTTPFKFEIPAKYRKSMFSAPTPDEPGTGNPFKSSSQPRLQHPQNMAPAVGTKFPAVSTANPFAGSSKPAKVKSILDPEMRRETFDTSLPWARFGTAQPTNNGESSYDPSNPFPPTTNAGSESTEDGTTDDSSNVSESPTPTQPQSEPQSLLKHPEKFDSFFNDYMNCKDCGGVHFGKCTVKEGSAPSVESQEVANTTAEPITSSSSLIQAGEPAAQVDAAPTSGLDGCGDDAEPRDDKSAANALSRSKDLEKQDTMGSDKDMHKVSNSREHAVIDGLSESQSRGVLAFDLSHETLLHSRHDEQVAAPVCLQHEPARDEDGVNAVSISTAGKLDAPIPTPATVDVTPTQQSESQAEGREEVFAVANVDAQPQAAEHTNAQPDNENKSDSPISPPMSPFAFPLFITKTKEADSRVVEGHRSEADNPSDMERFALPPPLVEADVNREGEASSAQTEPEVALRTMKDEPFASDASPAPSADIAPARPPPASLSSPLLSSSSSASEGSSKGLTGAPGMAPETSREKEDFEQRFDANEIGSTTARPVRDLPILKFSDEAKAAPRSSKQKQRPSLRASSMDSGTDRNLTAIALLRNNFGAGSEQSVAEYAGEGNGAGGIEESTDAQARTGSRDAEDDVDDLAERGSEPSDSPTESAGDETDESLDDKGGAGKPEDENVESIDSASEDSQSKVLPGDDASHTVTDELVEVAPATEVQSAEHDNGTDIQADSETREKDTRVSTSHSEDAQLEGFDCVQSDNLPEAGTQAAAADEVEVAEHTEEAGEPEATFVNESVNEDFGSKLLSQPQRASEAAAQNVAERRTTFKNTLLDTAHEPLDSLPPHSASEGEHTAQLLLGDSPADPSAVPELTSSLTSSPPLEPLARTNAPNKTHRRLLRAPESMMYIFLAIIGIALFSILLLDNRKNASQIMEKVDDGAGFRKAQAEMNWEFRSAIQHLTNTTAVVPYVAEPSPPRHIIDQIHEILELVIVADTAADALVYAPLAIEVTSDQFKVALQRHLPNLEGLGSSPSFQVGSNRIDHQWEIQNHMSVYNKLYKSSHIMKASQGLQRFPIAAHESVDRFLSDGGNVDSTLGLLMMPKAVARSLCLRLTYVFCNHPKIYRRLKALQNTVRDIDKQVDHQMDALQKSYKVLHELRENMVEILTTHKIIFPHRALSRSSLFELDRSEWYYGHVRSINPAPWELEATWSEAKSAKAAATSGLALFGLLTDIIVTVQHAREVLEGIKVELHALKIKLAGEYAAAKLDQEWSHRSWAELGAWTDEGFKTLQSVQDPSYEEALLHLAADKWYGKSALDLVTNQKGALRVNLELPNFDAPKRSGRRGTSANRGSPQKEEL